MSHRMLQVNENLRRELSQLLTENYTQPGSLLTLTQVHTNPDLRRAVVWLSVLQHPNPQEMIDLLNERSLEFYEPLSERLKMKHIPQLEFRLDDQADELSRIDSLLDEIKGRQP